MKTGSPNKSAFFFGSFNPIHLGHLAIADFVIAEFSFEKVFFIISPVSPDKKNCETELISLNKRIEFLKVALEKNFKFRLDLRETKRQKKIFYTIDSVLEIKKELKLKELEKISLLLGTDNFFNLESWKSIKELKKHCQFLVFPRSSKSREKLKEFKNSRSSLPEFYKDLNWRFVEAPILEISASLIRKHKKEKKSYQYFLPEEVYQKFKD